MPAMPCPDDRTPLPRRVFLFSGHMVDAPDRAQPRFPPAAVPAAARRIAEVLQAHGAGPGDLALSQAAAGGDLLFLEACLARGVHCRVLLPFGEEEFVERSVLPASGGAQWRERYGAVRAALAEAPRVMADALGPLPPGEDPFERANRWLLDTALAWGARRLCFVCLWDGAGGDGPGGTAHMVREVRQRGGEVVWIDVRALHACAGDGNQAAGGAHGALLRSGEEQA